MAMQKEHVIHGAWALAATGAFVLGGLGKGDPSDSAAGSSQAGRAADGGAGAGAASVLGAGSDRAGAPVAAGADGPGSATANGGAVALSDSQIAAISADAFSDPNPLRRSLAFTKLLEGITPENAQTMLQAMRDGQPSGDQWRLFLYAWGGVDGAGAMAYAAENLEGDRLQRFQDSTLTGWASKDPTAAMAFVDSIPDADGGAEQRARLMNSLIGGLADYDIGLATDYTFQLAEAGNREAGRYLYTIASEQIRKEGLDGGIAWAENLPDGDLKGSALDTVAGRFVNSDPEAASAWAAQFADASWGARVIEEVGDEWAERDPKASVAWLETLPQGAGRNEGTYSAFREWAQRDAMAASQHLVDMPDSAAKDHAVRGLSRTIAARDPQSAIAWAETIQSDAMRTETLTRAGQEWFRRDSAAAAEWLSTSGLSAEAQEQVVNPPQRDRRRG